MKQEHAELAARVGRELRRLRQRKGVVMEQVARDLGWTVGSVGMIERGERLPSLPRFFALMNYYDVDSELCRSFIDE